MVIYLYVRGIIYVYDVIFFLMFALKYNVLFVILGALGFICNYHLWYCV